MTSAHDGPSLHLAWTEIGCHDGTPYPSQWRDLRALLLAKAFEAIREKAGNQPLTILSCYRTPSHNAKVGGAPNSQHVQGRAIDLRPPTGMSVEAFFRLIKALANEKDSPIRGIGRYPTFVHVDVRPTPSVVVFYKSKSLHDLPLA